GSGGPSSGSRRPRPGGAGAAAPVGPLGATAGPRRRAGV
ncbi:MAG: hypothetical protein AVDCRST_MAG66-3897, partial [uncultured Pseudonocardia sp.]